MARTIRGTISHSESYHVQKSSPNQQSSVLCADSKGFFNRFVPQKEFQPEGSVSAETDSSNEQIGTAESTASDSKETTDSSFQPQNKVPQTDESTLRTARPSITYSTHVKNRGWLPNVSSGQLSGTTGQSLQVEAFVSIFHPPSLVLLNTPLMSKVQDGKIG